MHCGKTKFQTDKKVKSDMFLNKSTLNYLMIFLVTGHLIGLLESLRSTNVTLNLIG